MNHWVSQSVHALALTMALIGATQRNASADTATTTDDAALDEVVVIANRAPEPLSKVGNSVTVLTDADIKQSQAVVAVDLLAQTPGLTFARNGGVGAATQVYIRGAESSQTVVLIDGVQLNDPSQTAGGFDFGNLLTSSFSRIEILRGAQSTLYGSQAIGGVISITTADPTGAPGAGITAEGGSNDTGYVSGDIGGKNGGLAWRVSGNWYGTSGIPDFDEKLGGVRRDASQIGGTSGQLRYDVTPDVQLDLRGYYSVARTDFDGYDTPKTGYFSFGDDNEYGKTSDVLGYAGLTLRSPDRTLTNRVAIHYTETDTHEYDPDGPADPYYSLPLTLTFYGIGRNQRAEYQGTWAISPDYQLVFGAQHERSSLLTDSPIYDYPAPMPLENHATIDSGYAQLQGEVLSGLTLTAGERYDRHDVYGGHSTGALAAAWALNDNTTILRASFSQGFKAPSLYELYSNYGNQTLRPETATSWDAGVEQHLVDGSVVLSAAYFQRHSRDLINFFECPSLTDCPNEFGGYYANIERTAAHGVELQGAVSPNSQLALSANYTLTDTEDQSPGSTTYGNQLPRRPRQAANASVTYRWPVKLSTSIAARYGGRSFDDAANEIALGGYVLVDLRVSYAVQEHLELYARVENATGKHYETAYQYGTLGRTAFAGARATF